MTTSTNETDSMSAAETGGALADALTLVRILLTPVVMLLIFAAWQTVEQGGINVRMTTLASFLFLIAALTDIFDDYLGGGAKSVHRKLGYLDDIADTVLVVGTLAMLLFVVNRAGMMHWTFALPSAIIILREIVIGLFKGFELSRHGWPDNTLSSAKAGFVMFGTCLLLASPWLTQWIDLTRANESNVMDVFNNASPIVWLVGETALWIGAVFSILSALKILRTDFNAADEA